MASLPSNTFMFNYNAREYNSSTRTFPKTQGQLFDQDIVLSGTPSGYNDVSVLFGSNAYMGKQYSNAASNPFNRDASNSTFTFIYKTSGFTDGGTNLFGNRDDNYNYMVRGNMFHTQDSGFLSLTPSSSPQIVVIRIQANGHSERKVVDVSGNTIQSTSASSINWGGVSRGFAFFAGYRNGGEKFQNRFYWMYCSLEALTDNEIKKVIAYNERLSTFEPDTTALTGDYRATAFTVNLTANENTTWSATTIPSWVTVSP